MPHIQSIYDEFGTDIEVLTVNIGINDSINNIQNLYNKNGYNLPTFFDQEGEITQQFGIVGTPYHLLIDQQGRIIYHTFLASDKLDKNIRRLISSH